MLYTFVILAACIYPTIEPKYGVDLENISTYMYAPLVAAGISRKLLGFNSAIVTSTNDGTHIKNSKHYLSLAVDLRTNDMSSKKAKLFYNYLNTALGEYYEVIFYKSHIHIEYND